MEDFTTVRRHHYHVRRWQEIQEGTSTPALYEKGKDREGLAVLEERGRERTLRGPRPTLGGHLRIMMIQINQQYHRKQYRPGNASPKVGA